MIRMLALDVDGVLTDDRVILDEAGRESKAISYRDIDGVFLARRQGLEVSLVTGEDSPWVDMIAKRLEVEVRNVSRRAKDKAKAMRALAGELGIALDEIAYVGNSSRDAEVFPLVRLGMAPADATATARSAAHHVLACKGGDGAVAEAVETILLGQPWARPAR
jgi:3-deoxy-D-manno-octulosonate 8-phosphate phosphatase (KDO 8-P phosphatase)